MFQHPREAGHDEYYISTGILDCNINYNNLSSYLRRECIIQHRGTTSHHLTYPSFVHIREGEKEK